VGFAVCLSTCAAAPLISRWFGDARILNLVRWASLAFLIAPIGQQYQALLQKELLFDNSAKAETYASCLGGIVSVVLAAIGQGVYALIWGSLASTATRAALLFKFGRNLYDHAQDYPPGDLSQYLEFGIYQVGERIVSLVGSHFDKLLIGLFLGYGPLGYYSVSYQLVNRPYHMLNPVLTRVAFPVLARVQMDTQRLRRGFLEVVGALALVLFPLYGVMFAAVKPLVEVLLGRGWEPAVPIIQILIVSGILCSIGNPIGSLLLATGRVGLSLGMNVIGVTLSAASVWLGVRWGIEGVAFSLVCSMALVRFPIGILMQWIAARVKPWDYLKAILPAAMSSIVMVIVILGLGNCLRGPAFLQLVLSGSIGVTIYLLVIVWTDRLRLERLWNAALLK
jgi:O-antigen/teichoic acid export membrane protein